MPISSENAAIAVLDQKVTDLTSTVQEVRGDMKDVKKFMSTMNDNYITRGEFTAFRKQYWLSHSLTAILSLVMAALIYLAFGVHHG